MAPDAGSMRRCPDWSVAHCILRHVLEMQNQRHRIPVRLWENQAMSNDDSGFIDPAPHLQPSANPASNCLRFVLLWHSFPYAHWDWMFEKDGELLTFRAPPGSLEPLRRGIPQSWTQLTPHRLLYLDYEGPVSGNRGEVRKILGGNCLWLEGAGQVIRLRLVSPELSGILELHPPTHHTQWEARWGES